MEKIPFCPNCEFPLDEDSNFCGNCGQKNGSFKSNFWEFFKEFISTTFNLENKFFSTLGKLFNPAQLTIEFFNGVRKKYYHPFRIYFVSIILLFFAISLVGKISTRQAQDSIGNSTSDTASPSQFESRFLKKNQVKKEANNGLGTSDSRKNNLSIQKRYINESFNKSKLRLQDSSSLAILDSTFSNLYFIHNSDTIFIRDTSEFYESERRLFTKVVKLSFEDRHITNLDTIIKDKELVHWLDKVILKTFIKLSREGFGQAIWGNLTWFLLAIVPVLALILKIFYSKKRSYFLEHYVFLLELFSALILISIGFLLLNAMFNKVAFFLLIALLSSYLFTLLSFKKYYKQGWILTFIKLLAIGVISFLMVIISTLAFAIVTAFFY